MKKKYACLIIILLIVGTFAAFGRIAGNNFINLDDHAYITENYHIKSGITLQSAKWAFTSLDVFYWQPLTWLSHMLDWSLFGANASGHHLVSLLLHIGAVIFLFLFLNKTTNNLWPSAFAAAFFALHPLRVESVAWAAERKDVLSMFFGMACLYAYAFYAESSKLSRYLLCLILFALALMSKPMMVTLPFVLMLLDYWPLKRWPGALNDPTENRSNSAGKLILEKFPFLLLAVASSIVTFLGQNKTGAVASLEYLPFFTRAANAIISYTAYLEKIFWPVNLAVFYPYDLSLSLWKVLISGIILVLITLAVFYYMKKLPFLFVGWLWYLVTLIPLIGLVQAGLQSMADRHTYLPSIGIAFILAGGIPFLWGKEDSRKKILLPAAITILIIMALLTWKQCGYWKNGSELFSHAALVTKDNYLAHNSLGVALFEKGRMEEAVDHYNKAISIAPLFPYVYNNRGVAYIKLGRSQQSAIDDFNQAINLKPDYADAYNNRGIVYFDQDNVQMGCRDARKACSMGACLALKSAEARGYYCR